MATTVLVTKGLVKIGASTGVLATDIAAAVDFSDAILSAKISVNVDTIEVPPTLATPKVGRAGSKKYQLDLGYLSNDTSLTTELFSVLWTAAGTPDCTLVFAFQARDGAVSATNPQWQGYFIVDSASLGGTAEALSEGSGSFQLTAAPVRAIV
jgi:hypothetical protein